MDRASPSTTHEVSSNVVRAAGTVHGDRWLEPIFLHRELYKPDHSNRTDAGDKQLGKRTDPVGFAFGRANLPANLELSVWGRVHLLPATAVNGRFEVDPKRDNWF